MSVQETHTYLKARTAVMADRLYSPQLFDDLLQLSLEEVCAQSNLSELLDTGADESKLNLAVERALINTLMHELSILMRPLVGPARDILVHWTRKYELYNLKALIRGKLLGLSYDELRGNLHELPALISLPHENLLRTENIAELLRQLEVGQYGDIAIQARKVYEDKNEPFSLDATIDQRYYAGLLKRARLIPAEDRAPLMQLIGAVIDQQNLLWLLRYRFNYELSPSETYYLLLPFGHHLQRENLVALVNLNNTQQVMESLPESMLADLGQLISHMDIEKTLEAMTAQQAQKSLKYSTSAITRSLAYLILREMDLGRLFAIIQGKVLNLDVALIREAAGLDSLQAETAHV
jgi:V/A-type H+-transporting ATPase subunit C